MSKSSFFNSNQLHLQQLEEATPLPESLEQKLDEPDLKSYTSAAAAPQPIAPQFTAEVSYTLIFVDEWGVTHEFHSQAEYDAYMAIDKARDAMEAELVSAAKSGNVELLQMLLAEKHAAIAAGDPNFTAKHLDEYCARALYVTIAAGEGDKIGAIKILLAQESHDPANHSMSYDVDAVLGAISNGDPAALTAAVLNNPSYLNIDNKYGITTLGLVMKSDNPAMFNAVLPLLDINAANRHKATVLEMAVVLGKAQVVDLLLHDDRLKVEYPKQAVEASLEGLAPLEMLSILMQDGRFDVTKFDDGLSDPLESIVRSEVPGVLDLVLSSKIEISPEVARDAIVAAIKTEKPIETLQKLLGDARFKAGLNYHDEEHPTVLMVAKDLRKDAELIDFLKSQDASYGTITPKMVEAALNRNDYQLIEEFLAEDGNIVNSTYNEPSLIEKMATFYGFNYVKPEALDQFNQCLGAILNHPNLVMTKEIAQSLIKTATNNSPDKLQVILANERVMSTDPLSDGSIIENCLGYWSQDGGKAIELLLSKTKDISPQVARDLIMRVSRNIDDLPIFEMLVESNCVKASGALQDPTLVESILEEGNYCYDKSPQAALLKTHGAVWNPSVEKLMTAIRGWQVNMVKVLAHFVDLSDADAVGILQGDLSPEIAQALIGGSGTSAATIRNIDTEDGEGRTVLGRFKAWNREANKETIEALEAVGATWHPTEGSLYNAVYNGDTEFVLEHFGVGVSVNAPLYGRNILLQIVGILNNPHENPEQFQKHSTLLNAVLARDDFVMNPQIAKDVILSYLHTPEALNLVLSHPKMKKYINTPSTDGVRELTMLDHALEANCNHDVQKVLEIHRAKVTPTSDNLFYAIGRGSLRLMSEYLRLDPSMVNAMDANGCSALSRVVAVASLIINPQALTALEIVLAHPNLVAHNALLEDPSYIGRLVSLLSSNPLLSTKALLNFVQPGTGVPVQFTDADGVTCGNAELNALAAANLANKGPFLGILSKFISVLGVNTIIAEFCGSPPLHALLPAYPPVEEAAAVASSDPVVELGAAASQGLDHL